MGSAISLLKITARTSAFAFKGNNEDIRTIGETLGVAVADAGSACHSRKVVGSFGVPG